MYAIGHNSQFRSRIVEIFGQLPFDGVITHTALAEALGTRPDATAVWAACRWLEKHRGVVIQNIRGHGWMRLADADIVRQSTSTIRKMHRHAKRSVYKLRSADPGKLTKHEAISRQNRMALFEFAAIETHGARVIARETKEVRTVETQSRKFLETMGAE
jgi:hypothetical protein